MERTPLAWLLMLNGTRYRAYINETTANADATFFRSQVGYSVELIPLYA